MRPYCLTAFVAPCLLLGGAALRAQTVGVQSPSAVRVRPVRDTALVNVLNNFQVLGEKDFIARPGLTLRVFAVGYKSGSAQDGESDRIVHSVFVAVSEFGEYPEQRLFRLGPLYAPKVDSLTADSAAVLIYLSWGREGRRQRARVEATLDGLHIIDLLGRRRRGGS